MNSPAGEFPVPYSNQPILDRWAISLPYETCKTAGPVLSFLMP
jgi:hypothetical protein